MQRVIPTNMVNDIGLLSAEQIPAFRAFLVESGLQVRDSGTGQFFLVRLPELPRWMPIERGRAGAPVTPDALRPFVASFLKRPNSATGEVRAARQAAERAVARAAFALPRECAPVERVESEPGEDVLCTSAREFQSLGEQRAAQRALKAPAPTAQVVSHQGQPANPTPLSRYLSDLRDDFALHAPLVQQHNESVRSLAIRRWEYADVMLATRIAKTGD